MVMSSKIIWLTGVLILPKSLYEKYEALDYGAIPPHLISSSGQNQVNALFFNFQGNNPLEFHVNLT